MISVKGIPYCLCACWLFVINVTLSSQQAMASKEEIDKLMLSEPADLRVPHILTYRRRAEYITHFLKIDDIKAILLQEMRIKQKVYQQITHKLVSDGSVAASEVFLSGVSKALVQQR